MRELIGQIGREPSKLKETGQGPKGQEPWRTFLGSPSRVRALENTMQPRVASGWSVCRAYFSASLIHTVGSRERPFAMLAATLSAWFQCSIKVSQASHTPAADNPSPLWQCAPLPASL